MFNANDARKSTQDSRQQQFIKKEVEPIIYRIRESAENGFDHTIISNMSVRAIGHFISIGFTVTETWGGFNDRECNIHKISW